MLELRRLGLLLEHVQRAQEREAARDHRRELAGHDGDVARLHAAVAVEQLLDGRRRRLLVNVRHREAAQPELGGDGGLRVAGDLAGGDRPGAVERLVDEGGCSCRLHQPEQALELIRVVGALERHVHRDDALAHQVGEGRVHGLHAELASRSA